MLSRHVRTYPLCAGRSGRGRTRRTRSRRPHPGEEGECFRGPATGLGLVDDEHLTVGAAEELTDDQIDHIIATNLTGSIQVIRAALPHLRAQGGGRVIQVSTYGGQAAFPGGSMYHATKWGIEGFAEAVAQEVAPFGIGVTIVEPGGARTEFRYGSSRLGPALETYDGTPAAAIRAVIEEGTAVPPGDPAKMAAAIIASTDTEPAPSRIVLGSDAFGIIRKTLADRLAVIESQRETAAATDFPHGQ